MNKVRHGRAVGLLLISLFFLLGGCASSPRTHIPQGIDPIPAGKARIIVTRPSLIALAIPPLIVLDYGTQIDANGLVLARKDPFTSPYEKNKYIKFAPIDYVEKKKTIFNKYKKIAIAWFNPHLVKNLFCGNENRSAKAFHEIHPKGFVIPRRDLGTGKGVLAQGGVLPPAVRKLKGPYGEDLHGSTQYWILPPIQVMEKIRRKAYMKTLVNSADEMFQYDLRRYGIDLDFKYKYDLSDSRLFSRNVQAIGVTKYGDTVIWDRSPGQMRLGALAHNQGLALMPMTIEVSAGKTYYVDFTLRSIDASKWTLRKIE